MATITYLLYANMGPTSIIPAGIILAQLPIQAMLLKLYLKARYTYMHLGTYNSTVSSYGDIDLYQPPGETRG